MSGERDTTECEAASIISSVGDRRESRSEKDNWASRQLIECPTVILPISSLAVEDSPRLSGENGDHSRILAEIEGDLPPIVVHRTSMRVVDGVHRVRAAQLRGSDTIEAVLYDGSVADAFVLAVNMNTTHGLPLARADRIAAVHRIMTSHPQWSNRMIASIVGLAANTVARIRRCPTAQIAQSDTRIGRDGRTRPLNSAGGRQKVRELLAEKPEASSRAIAKQAGVSPSTVQDVRQRLAAGEEVVPDAKNHPSAVADLTEVVSQRVSWQSDRHARPAAELDIAATLESLRRDPSLRFSDAGRFLLRWLDMNRAGLAGYEQIIEVVPEHCAGAIVELARQYASAWTEFAMRLEQSTLRKSG